jgi:molybdopterin/thiamine biosynthesis adenylyltransferase/rhodanese-related sulfurtransferase
MLLEERLEQLKGCIRRVSPTEALARTDAGAVLIDVREQEEIAQGLPSCAQAVARGYLEMRINDLVPNRDQEVLLMCAATTRSLLAADDLRLMHYTNVAAVEGGFDQWKAEGLPYIIPELSDPDSQTRYLRQIALPEIGRQGQQKLSDARVLVVGAGGLGSPAALYLAAAGVGTLGLVDDDKVDRSNLHRQVLHRDDRVGLGKTDSARLTLEALNPSIEVKTHAVRLSATNVESIFANYDLVVDGSDNFPTRYLINDACIKLGLPNIYGAVQGMEGQVTVFAPGGQPCYRCLFTEPPPPELAPSCSQAGVLGVVPGLIGLLQALEAIKLITDIGQSLVGRLLLFDGRTSRLREVQPRANPDCAYCASGQTFPGYIDYVGFCQHREESERVHQD